MSNDDWIKQCESFEKTYEIVRKIAIGSTKGLVLKFEKFGDAKSFEDKFQAKAWGNGVCCRIHNDLKIFDYCGSIKNSCSDNNIQKKIDSLDYVVVFPRVERANLLELVKNLTDDFKEQELAEINKLFSKLDWFALRYVGDGDRYLRIGVDTNSLNKSQLEDLITGYQNLMGELFPKVKKLSTRQVMAILKASQSFYFADLGT